MIYSSSRVEEGGEDGTIPAGYGFTLVNEDGTMAEMRYGGMSTDILKVGTYRLYLLTSGYSENELSQYLRCPGGPVIYTMEKKADGTLSVYKGDPTETNGIEGITIPSTTTTPDIYNMNGMKLPNMQKGINIIKSDDGKILKVIK